MIIGFNQRSQTVSEHDPSSGTEFRRITIDVTAERISERSHIIIFRYLESSSTAIVENNLIQRNPSFDALFSNEDSDPIQEFVTLRPGEDTVPSLEIAIRNDFLIEPQECFTIGVYHGEATRKSFQCKEDNDATNFFCYHTVCIEDDDGNYFNNCNIALSSLLPLRFLCCCICTNTVYCC